MEKSPKDYLPSLDVEVPSLEHYAALDRIHVFLAALHAVANGETVFLEHGIVFAEIIQARRGHCTFAQHYRWQVTVDEIFQEFRRDMQLAEQGEMLVRTSGSGLWFRPSVTVQTLQETSNSHVIAAQLSLPDATEFARLYLQQTTQRGLVH